MSRFRSLAALPLIFSVTAAAAADLPSRSLAPVPTLAPLPVSSWAGFYAGSIFGIGYGTFRSSQLGSSSFSKAGQTGGGLLGYNFQSGSFVYGLEGDITLDLIRGHNAGNVGLVAHDVDTLYTSRVRGRLGYDLGAFLPYVAGGVAFNETYVYNGPAAADLGQTRRQTGFTVGGGVDWKFMAPFFGPLVLRAEYVYDGYPGQNYLGNGPGNAPIRVRSSAQYGRLALIYRPGDTWRPPASSTDGVVDWSGAYAGLIGGGFRGHATTSAPGVASTNVTASGPAGGIYMGRNLQFGAFVLGFDSSTMLTGAKGTSSLPGAGVGTLSYRNYIQADLRGRVGYSIGRFLPFVAAGVSFGRSEQIDPTTGSERGRIPTEAWTVGGGLDYMLTDRFSMRGEYLYGRDFKSRQVTLDGVAYNQKRDEQTFRLGLAYHFH